MTAPDGCWCCAGCWEWEELLKGPSAQSTELDLFLDFWDFGETFLQKSGQTGKKLQELCCNLTSDSRNAQQKVTLGSCVWDEDRLAQLINPFPVSSIISHLLLQTQSKSSLQAAADAHLCSAQWQIEREWHFTPATVQYCGAQLPRPGFQIGALWPIKPTNTSFSTLSNAAR